jgi:hypothetical protein
MVEVAPVTLPFSVKVPNTVPPAKTSMNIPLDVNAGELEKMVMPVFVEVKAPDTESTSEPMKCLLVAGCRPGLKLLDSFSTLPLN